MNEVSIDRFDGMGFMRNKGGYTSLVSDMGVQWDFKPNCGIRKYRNPVMALKWTRDEFSPGFQRIMCERKNNHFFLVGDYGSVCKFCGMYIPHGKTCPISGVPQWWHDEGLTPPPPIPPRKDFTDAILSCLDGNELGLTHRDLRKKIETEQLLTIELNALKGSGRVFTGYVREFGCNVWSLHPVPNWRYKYNRPSKVPNEENPYGYYGYGDQDSLADIRSWNSIHKLT